MASTKLFDTDYTTRDSIKELSDMLDEPQWLLDRRYKAYEHYSNLPYDKDTLFYKYTSFRDFDPKKLSPSWKGEQSSTINDSSIALEELTPYMFETEQGLSSKLPEELIEKGIIFESLHELIKRDEDLAKKIISDVDKISEGFDKLGSLAQAFARNITVLYVPKGVVLEKPLVKINSIGDRASANFSETITYFEDETQVTYIDVFQRNDTPVDNDQLYAGLETTIVGENSDIKSLQLQDWNPNTLHIMSRIASVDRYAKYRTLTHLQGGHMSRQNSRINLIGIGSEGYDLFASFGNGKQRFDVKSELHHIGRETIGQTHARQVMLDKSESILRGLIVIPESGINADSWLTSQGMTIDKGKVTAIPALQIDQNDVKAAHAASVEPLNEDLLFYLETRGVPRETAREILVKGYFEYVMKIIENEEIINVSRDYLAKKYEISQE